MPATTRDDALARVYRDARAAGLDDEGARVAVAIAITEHGYEGGQGDLDQSALGSAGTFQFFFGPPDRPGMGNAYARAHGIPEQRARDYLKNNPHAANAWALGPDGYLGQTIRRGQAQGLHGADLATYAQRVGQRSVDPGRSGANYQTVSTDVGQGGAMADGRTPAQQASNAPQWSPSQRAFDAAVAAKGDPVSIVPAPGQAEVSTQEDELNFLGKPTGKKITKKTPNPSPVYRYTFADGTYVDAVTPGGDPDKLEVRGGTALRSTAQGAQAPAAPPHTVERNGTTYQWNPQTRQWEPAAGLPDQAPKEARPPNNKTVVTRNGKSYIYDPETNTFTPAQGLPDEPGKTTTHTVGGRAFTLDESGHVVSTVDLRSPQQVQKEGIDLQTAQVDLAGKQRDLLPKQQQILQGHLETVTYVQGMLERGEIDQPTADAWIATSKAASEAALRGATPFQEMKDRREAEQARQRMGTDLLTQRLSSGAGLASSLLSAASGLAGHAMLRPGQTSLGVDPLAQLMPLLGQLQGGQDVTPFARGLLMGGQQGPPPAASGMPGALPAGL